MKTKGDMDMKRKAKEITCGFAAIAAAIAFSWGVFGLAKWRHGTSGECGGERGCGWCWCDRYDGRDFLHDPF